MYEHLRQAGFYVEALGAPLTCFDAQQYGKYIYYERGGKEREESSREERRGEEGEGWKGEGQSLEGGLVNIFRLFCVPETGRIVFD